MKRKNKSFEAKLAELEDLVADMGDAPKGLVAETNVATFTGASALAAAAATEDKRVAVTAEAISELSVSLLAIRQPVPGELRRIVAALRITYDHKRIAHLAASIAKMSGLSNSLEETATASRRL
jgi:phosphate transport system protein